MKYFTTLKTQYKMPCNCVHKLLYSKLNIYSSFYKNSKSLVCNNRLTKSNNVLFYVLNKNYSNDSEHAKRLKPNRINLDKVFLLFETLELEPKNSEEYIKLKYCPLCPKPHNDDPTNLNTMNVHKDKLVYNCFRCGSKGHISTLIRHLNNGTSKGYMQNNSSASATEREIDENYDRNIITSNNTNNEDNYNNTRNNNYSYKYSSNYNKSSVNESSFNNYNNYYKKNSTSESSNNNDFNYNNRYQTNNYTNKYNSYKSYNSSNNNSNTKSTYDFLNNDFSNIGNNLINIENEGLLNNTALLHDMYKRIQGLNNENMEIIKNYLINERKIKLETIERFNLGLSYEKFSNLNSGFYNLPCVTYPMFYPLKNMNFHNNITYNPKIPDKLHNLFNCNELFMSRVKVRGIGKELKKFQRSEPTGAAIPGLFGLDLVFKNYSNPNTINPSDINNINSKLNSIINENNFYEQICITEGEFDAMVVYQETGIPCVSLPNGCSSLPNDLLPIFKPFNKIYLWMDADHPGKIASQNFSKKLGLDRTYIINSRKNNPLGPKDANEALINGEDLNKYFEEAKLLEGENVIKANEIRSDVIQFLTQYETFSGYKSTSFKFFNDYLKGLRNGEFTILTGETGCGKTTFLTQLSLDFLEQRIPTIWGSFEIKNDKLASMFLMQLAKKDLRQADIKDIEYHSDIFEKLPLYFLKFHGSQNIDEIMVSINYAVKTHDIQLIVLDNLQFMTGAITKINKFDYQDEIIHKLRLFATEKNVHIILVIHPKKTEEALKVNSIFGTGKASQEADNIVILQNYKGLRIIEVAKNRFNGTIGKSVMAFDKSTCRFFQLQDQEFLQFSKGEVTLDQLADNYRKENNKIKLIEQEKIIKEVESKNIDVYYKNTDIKNLDQTINNTKSNIKLNEEFNINNYNINENMYLHNNQDLINQNSDSDRSKICVNDNSSNNNLDKDCLQEESNYNIAIDYVNADNTTLNVLNNMVENINANQNNPNLSNNELDNEDTSDTTTITNEFNTFKKLKKKIKKLNIKTTTNNNTSDSDSSIINKTNANLNNTNSNDCLKYNYISNTKDSVKTSIIDIGTFHNEILPNTNITSSFHTKETQESAAEISKRNTYMSSRTQIDKFNTKEQSKSTLKEIELEKGLF